MLAQSLAGVPEAVPRLRLAETVAEFPLQFQSLLAERDGLRVIAEHGVEPADRVERPGLPGPVAGGAEQVEGLLRMPERLPVAALTLQQPGLMAVRVTLADGVPGRVVQPQCLAQPGIGVAEAAQPKVGAA